MSTIPPSQTPPPGWYPDPHGPAGQLRYWDGMSWTEHRHRPVGAAPAPPATAGGRELADFGTRLVALVVDGLVVGVLLTLIALVVVGLIALAAQADLAAVAVILGIVLFLVMFAVGFGYGVLFEGGPRGQTIGKYVMGLRVVRPDGVSPIGFGAALGRNVVKGLLSGAVFYLGYLWMLWDDQRRTWHDMAATSRVIRDPAPKPPFGEFLRAALRGR